MKNLPAKLKKSLTEGILAPIGLPFVYAYKSGKTVLEHFTGTFQSLVMNKPNKECLAGGGTELTGMGGFVATLAGGGTALATCFTHALPAVFSALDVTSTGGQIATGLVAGPAYIGLAAPLMAVGGYAALGAISATVGASGGIGVGVMSGMYKASATALNALSGTSRKEPKIINPVSDRGIETKTLPAPSSAAMLKIGSAAESFAQTATVPGTAVAKTDPAPQKEAPSVIQKKSP